MATFNVVNPSPEQARSKPAISTIYTAQLDVRSSDGESDVSLETQLPETFSLALSAEYDRPYAQPLSQIAGSAVGMGSGASAAEKLVTASTGATSLNKYMSAAIWSGGGVLQVNMPFVLTAYDDARTEVTEKFIKLLSLVAPDEKNGFLIAPGPTIVNGQDVWDNLSSGNTTGAGASLSSGSLGGDDITLRVGRFFVLNPCIIRSVDLSFNTLFESEGQPISATINVQIESYFTTTKQDIQKAFSIIV